MTIGADTLTKPRLDTYTSLALFVGLVAYPVVYCSGIMGQIVVPIFIENSRLHWWYFWLANLAFQWTSFALILAHPCQELGALGFNRRRLELVRQAPNLFGGLIVLLMAMAFVMPGVLYEGELPKRSQTIFMAPASTPERLFLIFGIRLEDPATACLNSRPLQPTSGRAGVE